MATCEPNLKLDSSDSKCLAILKAAESNDLIGASNLLQIDASLINANDEDGYCPLHRACHGNYVEMIKLLLMAGAPVDACTVDGWQPLHCAARWNCVESAAILLQNGADINARSNGGQTPLHLASTLGSQASPMLQLLLMDPCVDTTKHCDK